MATLDDLNTLINSHIQNGTLTLTLDDFTTAKFDTSVLAPIFNAYLPNNLVIDNAISSENLTRNTITVSGAGDDVPFGTMNLNAAFGLEGNVVSLGIVAIAQPGWTFATSFPILGITFLPELQFQSGHGLYLATGDMTLDDGTELTTGLSFKGQLLLAGNLQNYAWLLGNGQTVLIAGPIEIHQGVPEMVLTATVTDTISLGYIAVDTIVFSVTSSLGREKISDPPGVSAAFHLSTAFRFQNNSLNLTIPLTADFYYQWTTIRLTADLTNVIYATLAEFSSLMNGVDLGQIAFPSNLQLGQVLGLDSFSLQIDTLTQQLRAVNLGLRSNATWVIVQDPTFGTVLGVQDLGVSFVLEDPLGAMQLGAAIFGTLNLSNDGQLMLSAVYNDDFAVLGDLVEGTNIDLTQIVAYFLGFSVEDVPNIKVTELHFEAQPATSTYAGAISVESDWAISLGSTTLQVERVSFAINSDATATAAYIAGTAQIGSALIALDWQLPGDLLLTGTIPTIALTEIIESLSPWQLPTGFPNITLLNSTIYIQKFGDGGFYFAAGTTVDNFGTFELDFSEVAGQTGFTFGFQLMPGWQLKQLSSVFDSALFNAIYFNGAYLIVSSNNNPNFQFRSLTGSTLPVSQPVRGVQAGVMFYASLALDPNTLQSSPLYFVAQLLNGHTLDIGLQIPTNYQDTEFFAALGQPFALGKTSSNVPVLQLTALSLTIKPFRVYVDLHVAVLFNIHNTLLGLSGDLTLSGPTLTLTLSTTTPWVNPFGIQGLTLDKLAIAFQLADEGAGSLTLAGQVTLGTGNSAVTLAAAVQITLAAEEPVPMPDVLMVSEVGTIRLQAIVAAFVGSSHTPPVLQDIELFQFNFLIVANPVGWDDPLDGKHYGVGIAFNGQLRFYGLVAAFALQVSYSTGINASGQFSTPIRIGNVVTLANATDPTQGPFVTLNTTQAPYLNMAVSLKFFEISTIQLTATISNNAFYLSFNYTLTGIAAFGQLSVETYLRDGNAFSLSASARLDVSNVGPIKVGHYSLGTIPTSIRLSANFTISVGPGSAFTLVVGASFSLGGFSMTFSGINLSVTSLSLRSFADLPALFVQALKDNLWDIGRALFGNASALFNYVKSGALRLTDDIAKILKDYLHLDIANAAKYLKSVASVMAYDVSKIAKLLKSGFDAAEESVASALRSAAYSVEEVATAIGNVFKKDAEAVAAVLKNIGYELGDIATALKNVFGYSAKEVSKFFKKTWKIVDTVVCDALYAANYAKDKVQDAMEDVFDWTKKELQKAWDTLNPKNW